jgi:hypothetical protein
MVAKRSEVYSPVNPAVTNADWNKTFLRVGIANAKNRPSPSSAAGQSKQKPPPVGRRVLKTMIERTEERFGLKPEWLTADTAYGSAPTLSWLINEKNIAPHGFGCSAQIEVRRTVRRCGHRLCHARHEWARAGPHLFKRASPPADFDTNVSAVAPS